MSDGVLIALGGAIVAGLFGVWRAIIASQPKPESSWEVANTALTMIRKLEQQVNQHEARLTDALSTVDRLRQLVADAKSQADDALRKLDDALETIADLEPRLSEALETIKRIEAERVQEKAEYEAEMARRNDERSTMQAEIAELRGWVAVLSAQLERAGIKPLKPKTGPLGGEKGTQGSK